MKRQIAVAVTVLGVLGASYVLVGDSFSSVGEPECKGVPFTLGDQQYSSLSEVENTVSDNPSVDASYQQIKDHYDLCVKNGVVLQNPTPGGSS